MPAVVAAVVNALVIRKKLSQNVLDLLSNRENSEQAATITLKRFGFVRRFQIRQMIREARTSLTVVFGLFIALLIMMLGLNCYAVCSHVSLENKADTRFEYMYSYKFPTEAVPEGGVAAFGKTLKKEVFGYNLDVTLLGIDASNPYFDAAVTKGQNKVIISSAVARKFGLAAGDVLVLNDEEDEKLAAFTVDGVTAYASGLFVFMNLADMRDYFGETDTYYNIVFSDQPLNLETERLNNVTTREDSVKSANVFISQMTSLIITMVAVSLILLAVVMYLMMQVMVDRSAFGIALMKIFGYRSKELRKLYINGNFYVIAVGAVISIPLAKWVMDQVYPILVSNVAVGFNLNFPWWLYAGVYGMILFLYLVINTLLLQRLKKISHAEVLKNRE
jgi:ABC-type transport system, involved in lipoprotein release, permease component